MANYYRRDCGHLSMDAPWGKEPERALAGLCQSCLDARVGEVIPFARHGAAPKGASRNHRDGTTEAGVSVYEVVDGEVQYCGWFFGIAERPLYLGTGRIVGWGSDGEPLVQILTIAKAKNA